jgi:hypothetical protein
MSETQSRHSQLTPLWRRSVASLLARSRTEGLADRGVQLLVLKACRTEEERAFALSEFLRARFSWLDWHTLTQRQWQQRESRRATRQRNHDSGYIREKYVRCVDRLDSVVARFIEDLWHRAHRGNSPGTKKQLDEGGK